MMLVKSFDKSTLQKGQRRFANEVAKYGFQPTKHDGRGHIVFEHYSPEVGPITYPSSPKNEDDAYKSALATMRRVLREAGIEIEPEKKEKPKATSPASDLRSTLFALLEQRDFTAAELLEVMGSKNPSTREKQSVHNALYKLEQIGAIKARPDRVATGGRKAKKFFVPAKEPRIVPVSELIEPEPEPKVMQLDFESTSERMRTVFREVEGVFEEVNRALAQEIATRDDRIEKLTTERDEAREALQRIRDTIGEFGG